MDSPMKPDILAFFDEPTFTVTYLAIDPATKTAAIVDPVLDYDHASGKAHHRSVGKVMEAARAKGATIAYVLETHVHADHLSAAPWIKAQTGAKIVIGAKVCEVQRIFRRIFGAEDVSLTGSEFDLLANDGDVLALGEMAIEAIHTPGHTPACMSWKLGPEDVFVGDTLFMPDYGTARADFPGGDAATLYHSIQKLLALPPRTRLWMCHDYKAPGRDAFVWQTCVADQRAHNVHVHDGVDEASFVAMRKARDATLKPPALLLPSVQVNIRAGHFPPPDANGVRYLKTPVTFVDRSS
ncbi:MAG: MBL fold metallo-hydrolase [Alphaproteobacteria bacterium]|nr:MBL fold metallo-hydrolase [Alphaproteobacteria bacterium]